MRRVLIALAAADVLWHLGLGRWARRALNI